MNFFDRFRLAWQMARLPMYVPEVESEHYWGEEDGLVLRHFFNSSTGLKLKARLTNYVLKSAVQATTELSNLPYHCGQAHGIAVAVQVIENHFSPATADRSTTSEPTDAVTEFAEQFAA